MNYLNNKDLYAEVVKSKANDNQMSHELACMLQLLIHKFACKPCYIQYSYREDMQAYAMMMLVSAWVKFDETKYQNAFSYFTQCTYHSFSHYLNKEKRQRDIRDELLLKNGMNPSFNYSIEHADDEYNGDK